MFRFPWGDFHSLNLGWFLQKFNELREDWATAETGIDGALDAEIEKAEDALSDVFAARDAAAASATAAAGSASAAGTSATAAQNSATGAASSATLANQKATAAGLSEAAAAQSATQAGNSATAAAGSATTASNAATNAAASETAAGQSATAAAGSATAAATSETNAAASAARAEEVEESIPADYSELSAKVENNAERLTAIDGFYGSYSAVASSTWTNVFLTDWMVVKAGTRVYARFTAPGSQETIFCYIKQKDGESSINIGNGQLTSDITEKYVVATLTEDSEVALAVQKGTSTPVTIYADFENLNSYMSIFAQELFRMRAPSNLTKNSFVSYKDKLYITTQSVTQYADLIVGTNVRETTVGEILTQLLGTT